VKKVLIFYFLLFLGVIGADQALKQYVLSLSKTSYAIFPGVSCELLLNSGISCGFLQTSNKTFSLILLLLIVGVIGAVIVHAYFRFKVRAFIVGEILVIAGAISNLIDRALYGGVVDFILIGCKGMYFPAFNIADVAIVVGVLIMLVREIV
jgi:signal peptidase II